MLYTEVLHSTYKVCVNFKIPGTGRHNMLPVDFPEAQDQSFEGSPPVLYSTSAESRNTLWV